MKNLKNEYPNIIKGMNTKWLERFEKTKNNKAVERLFDFLEDKCLEESKKLDPLTEDLTISVYVISRSWKNFFNISLEKMSHNSEYDAWESADETPVEIEVQIEDYYKNWEETSLQEMVEDFLNSLPDPIDVALI